jgi:hypothetical protein
MTRQKAFKRRVRERMAKTAPALGDERAYDPRVWGAKAEAAMAERVAQACEQLGSAQTEQRGYSLMPAASRARGQLVKYSIRTIVPSRNVVTWWYISVSSSAPLPLPRP